MKLTWDEWHSFVIGWCEAISFGRRIHKMPMEYDNPLTNEYHYYLFGLAIGVFTWLVIIIGGIKCLI